MRFFRRTGGKRISFTYEGGGGQGGGQGGGAGGGGLVTKSRRSFFDFTSHEKQNFIFHDF